MADTFKTFKEGVIQRQKTIYQNHSVKAKYHPTWHTALAFFEGEHWKIWSKTDKRLRDFEPQTLNRKMVVNRIQMIVTTFVAHFMRELPTYYVNPNSNTPDDVNAADLAQNILQVEYSSKLETVLEEYFYWKWIIGTGIRGLFFDPTAAAEIKLPLYDDNGVQTGERITNVPDIGQLYLKVINPFNFYPVGGSTIEDCTEILYVEPLSLTDIKQRYGFEATAESIDTYVLSGTYHRDYREGHSEKFEDKAKVFQYYRKREEGFPNGLYAVIINDKAVEYKPNPYLRYGRNYPFTKSCAIPIPGQFFGKCPVEQLRRVQIAYNYVYSLMIQTIERMGKLKWWMPKGSNIDPAALDTKIGEIVHYSPSPNSPPPTQANLTPMPYYYFQMLEWLDKAFEDISGFHEVKSARLPTGANNPSGVMVNLLLEQDETRLTPAIKQYLVSLKQEARLYLKMVQDLYEEDRIIKITGIDKESEVRDFKGATLLDNNDVTVEIAPVLSESRSAWEETVKWAMQAQLIDPKTALQKLKLEHPKSIVNELSDERLALRENIEMRNGVQRTVNPWESDEVHLQILDQFLRTTTFERLEPDVQQKFLQHRQRHEQQQAQKFQQRLAAQQQQMQAMQGGNQVQGQQPPMGQAPPGLG